MKHPYHSIYIHLGKWLLIFFCAWSDLSGTIAQRVYRRRFIPFLINNSACLGHLHRQASPRESAAESRDLVTMPGLVS
jgi:hypothetical protein